MVDLLACLFSDQRFRKSRAALRSLPLVAGRRRFRGMPQPRLGRPIQRTRFRGRPGAVEVVAETEARSLEPCHVAGQARNHPEVRVVEIRARQETFFVIKNYQFVLMSWKISNM